MAKELTPVDVTNTPDLLRLAEEVRRSGQPRLLRRDDEDLAVLSPIAAPATRRTRTAKANVGQTTSEPLGSGIEASYQAIPALPHPLSDQEVTDIAWEDHVQDVVREDR